MMARFNSGGPEAHMLRMQAHLDEYENQFKKEPSKEDVQKAVQGACGKMDEENRITSGPLKNPELLLQWLKSIHFQGPILKMLTDNDLLKPKCWLGGGKSSGKNISRDFRKIFRFKYVLVMQWLRSTGGRKVQMVDRQIIKSSCTKYRKIFGPDISKIKFDY